MNIVLTESQQKVYDNILLNWEIANTTRESQVMLITGSAGTGKSTSVFQAIKQLMGENPNLPVKFIAPTHSAVAVLSKIEHKWELPRPVELATLASSLKLKPKRIKHKLKFVQTEMVAWNHEASIVLIDESSMIDTETFKMIQDASDGLKLLIYLGDPCQLPPVSDEQLKESPIFKAIEESYHLTEVMRYAGDSLIVANKIRDVMEMPRGGFFDIVGALPEQSEVIHKIPPQQIKDVFAKKFLEGKNIKVLAFRNDTVDKINQRIHEFLGLDQFFNEEGIIVNLAPIQMNNNVMVPIETKMKIVKHEEKLFDCNVLSSKLAGIKIKYVEVQFVNERFMGTFKAIGQDEANDYQATLNHVKEMCKADPALWKNFYYLQENFIAVRLPYATTIHKSQGETYDEVVLVTPDLSACRDHTMYNKLLYTAFTRAAGDIHLVLM